MQPSLSVKAALVSLCLLLTLVIAWLGTLAGRDLRVADEDRPG